MNEPNICLLTDSYKQSHWQQLPPKTEAVFSYLEARKNSDDFPFNEVVFFGLQDKLVKYLEGVRLTRAAIEEAKEFVDAHMGPGVFNYGGWTSMLHEYEGRLPIRIQAVPEGTVVPMSNILMSVVNTDVRYPWLVNHFEPLLSHVWYGCTVATLSREIKKVVLHFLERTGTPELIDYKLHDFGFRGVSSLESAGIGGAAHLLNFSGTDTIEGIQHLKSYYFEKGMPGNSIPASEHMTITSWGRSNELAAFANMLDQYPTGVISCVSDSYDIYKACKELWGDKLRDKVMARDGVLVVRPDSGDPCSVVLACLELLASRFGCVCNDKGYKVLDPHVRVIWGDGIGYAAVRQILAMMEIHGWSADNITFGMGGGLLQKVDRDSLNFAFKCSAVQINGEWHDVYKEPITSSMKVSKRGRLKLINSEGYKTVSVEDPGTNELQVVFSNGQLYNQTDFRLARERAAVTKGGALVEI